MVIEYPPPRRQSRTSRPGLCRAQIERGDASMTTARPFTSRDPAPGARARAAQRPRGAAGPALCLALLLLPAQAMAQECYADYKAKQDNPLKLHYGVAEISGPCSKGAAKADLAARLKAKGWTLLNVVSVFGAEGLDERKANAGSYYLRF